MKEGWLNDDYLVLFTEENVAVMSSKYGVDVSLPGYEIVGLRGWDELIVRDKQGAWHTVPAVPLDGEHMHPFTLQTGEPLQPDERFRERIKWYVKLLVFGGDANDEQNVTWVNLERHVELVAWWNTQYHAAKGVCNV